VAGALNIGVTAWVTGRAGTGVTGPAQRRWIQPWKVIALTAWIIAYFSTAPHYHAGVSHPVWGLYPASAPLLIIGLATAAAIAAASPALGAGKEEATRRAPAVFTRRPGKRAVAGQS
jgi:hypothetical protein